MDKKLTMDRRGFLAGGATALAAAGLMGLAGCAGNPGSGSATGNGSGSNGSANGNAVSSDAVVNSWQNPPAPIPADQIVETVDCDVLIIGAGTAGVVAAQSAAEAGANTVLIEKCAEFSARGHDVGVVDCKVQRDSGVTIDKALMREYYCQITCNKTDMGLFNIWMNKSGEVMDYYIDRLTADGLPCNAGSLGEAAAKSTNPCTKEFPTAIQFGMEQKTADGEYTNHLMVRYIEGYAREDGADIRYNTKAEQLIREGDGPVTGCIASTDNGYVHFNAKNGVIIATGGITQNEQMLRMWAPPAAQTDQILYTPIDGNTGDGLNMGMWIGAGHQKTNQATMALPSSAAAGGQLSDDGRGITWMTVNLNGERYVKENSPGPNLCHATLPQPASEGWSIFDANWETNILKMMPSGKDFRGEDLVSDKRKASFEEDIKKGLMYKADTLEGLAEAMGMPAEAFKAQVDRYNGYCASGNDEEFSMPAEQLFAIDTPPFYASRNRCGVLVVMYGLNVNAKSQVCNQNDVAIPGLYAIGNAQGNFVTDSYPILIPGISHGRCVTFGRLLGQALAKGETL